MKISLLLLLPSSTFGGAERTCLNLIKGINKKRFGICLVTTRYLFQYFKHNDIEKFIPLEDLGLDGWYKNFEKFKQDIEITASLVKNEHPDLVVGIMHYASLLLTFSNKFNHLKSKCVSSLRSPSTLLLNEFAKNEEQRNFLTNIYNILCRFSDGLTVPSTGVKDDLVRNFNADCKKITVINNSIDLLEIQNKTREKLDISFPNKFYLISAACRLSQEKNLPFLIKVFSEIRKKVKAKLLIVGDGPEKENLQAICKSLDLEKEVLFLGYQENPFKYIAASDLFVHTCIYEGFGNAIIEAMACRVPVVATACPYGPGEIISNGENGVLVDVEDSEGMTVAIKNILQDKKKHKELSMKGFQTASEYSVEKMVSAYELFFNKVLAIS
jgi:glycosyltransferase involved in cell wall biosynthesis